MPEIERLRDDLLDIWKRTLVIRIEIHRLDVLAIHPAQLLHVEDRRALRDTVIVELLDEVLEGHDLLVILRRPAEEGNEVHDGLGHEALIDQVLEGGMTGTLAELLVIFIRNQRTVHILRNLPAEGLIETIVLRARAQILVATNDVGDAHQMIVDDIGEIIGRIAVGLDEDHVIELGVIDGDVSVELVVEGRRALGRVVLTDNIWHAGSEVCLDFLLREGETVLIIVHDLFAVDHGLQRLQTLLRAEAVVCLALIDELLRILHIDALCTTLGLHVRTAVARLIRGLIRDQAGIGEGFIDKFDSTLNEALLVRILDTEKEVTTLMLRDEVGVECGTKVTYMHPSGRGRCISRSDLHNIELLSLSDPVDAW